MTGLVGSGAVPGLSTGVLLPEALLHSGPVTVLAAFVAVNTVMYAALAVAKILPKVYPTSWFTGSNRRAQNRSIHPDDADRVARRDADRAARRAAERQARPSGRGAAGVAR